jgi:hypothetical protein
LDFIAEAWFAATTLWMALTPGRLKVGPRRGPFHEMHPTSERIIRTIALVIGVIILANLLVRLTGRPPFLH